MANDLENLLVAVGEGAATGPVVFSWGVHQGIRGARWTDVHGDGRVVVRTTGDEQAQPIGRVDPGAIKELVDSLLTYDIGALKVAAPADPGRVLTLDVTGPGVSWQLQMSVSAPQDHPELADIQGMFSDLHDLAAAAAQEPQLPAPAPREVRPSTLFKGTMVLGGLMSCGVVAVVMLPILRKMPRVMDAEGLTLRNGQRFTWKELRPRRRVDAAKPDVVLGYDLLAEDGTQIRLAEGAFADGAAVVEYALERVTES